MPNPPPIIYKQGDLYWCDPDPNQTDTVGSEQKGDRIWLIVSIEKLHRGNCLVALPLSRHVEKVAQYAPPHLIKVPAEKITMEDGNPSINRVALTDQIRALDKRRLKRKAGFISHQAVLGVLTGLDFLFGRVFPSSKTN
jgi:mRNA-degrading endonuclease toxin of MazEF toxin-antitoxin module